jgi:hypothetical protein
MADRVIEELDRDEALRLISPGGIGRIAYTSRFGPTVLPVNYTLYEGAIIFRTAENGPLDEDLRIAVPVHEVLAQGGEGDDQPPAVGWVAVPLDQAAGFQGGDHVGRGLRGDEGTAGQLRGGQVGVAFQDGQRRVLEGGQPGRADEVVQPGSHGQLDLLDQVQQHRLHEVNVQNS